MVSFDGLHKLVSIWEVERDRRQSPRLEKMLVVDHRNQKFNELINYAKKVLDAVGLHYGPSHMEVIITEEGPTIVELNSRLHGSLDPLLTTTVSGENHVSVTVDAFVNSERFKRNVDKKPHFFGFCGHVLLLSPISGVLTREFPWKQLEQLPSFISVKRWVKYGDKLEVTTDLPTALGMVGLFDTQFDQLIIDWHSIRQIERRFFADLETLAE